METYVRRFLILSLVVVVAACADDTFRSVWGYSKCYSVVSWIGEAPEYLKKPCPNCGHEFPPFSGNFGDTVVLRASYLNPIFRSLVSADNCARKSIS
jgi:hypothetical protein